MYSHIKNLKIAGVAAAVSEKWDSIREISQDDETTVAKFIKKTGIQGRYSASLRQTSADFCFAAADELLRQKGVDREKIGVLVFVTQTADYRNPATAHVLQMRLGLSTDCITFDMNLGCSGFVYGLNVLSSLMNSSEARYGLLLAGDTAAREFSGKRKDKLGHYAQLLFGDAGTATLVEKAESGDWSFCLNSNGYDYKAIIQPYGFWRNPDSKEGRVYYSEADDIAVFNFSTAEAPAQIEEFYRRTGTSAADYDCLVLHQANLMIMKRIAKKTGFPEEKMLVSMNRFANTSCASIPLTLVDKFGEVAEDRSINALCCGYGVGLSWATVGLPIEVGDIIPLVHTDEYYKDGYNVEDMEENEHE